MATFELTPTRETLHGHFSRDLPPVLTLNSGDAVIYHRIPDAGWNVVPRTGPGTEPQKFEPRTSPADDGHCMMGPVAVRGAEPGMTLAVYVEEVVPGPFGWTSSGGWPHPVHEFLGTTDRETMLYWRMDEQRRTATNQFGQTLRLRPFCGVMGMPPAEPGLHPTPPPRETGGNLDCKELIAGTTLYLPIAVPGGLFSVGDGHAVQGDGEACVTAIECPMDRVRLSFELLPEMRISTPRARISDAWLTLGVDEDLNIASLRALNEMLSVLGEQYGVGREEALALASLVVDLRVTQIVNGVRGIHAVLPDGIIQQA